MSKVSRSGGRKHSCWSSNLTLVHALLVAQVFFNCCARQSEVTVQMCPQVQCVINHKFYVTCPFGSIVDSLGKQLTFLTNLKVLSTAVICKCTETTEGSVTKPPLQTLLRFQLAALQPSLLNMQTASSTDFGPTVLIVLSTVAAGIRNEPKILHFFTCMTTWNCVLFFFVNHL